MANGSWGMRLLSFGREPEEPRGKRRWLGGQFSYSIRMSYHAPHCLSENELVELERSECEVEENVGGVGKGVAWSDSGTRFVLTPVEAKGNGTGHAAEEKVCESVWVVYNYDHQTGRYERPRMAFASEAEAREYRREKGWVGVHRLDVWKSREAWKKAGEPVAEVD